MKRRMSVRAMTAGAVLAAQILLLVPTANAHHAESFTACRWRSAFHDCRESKIYLAGDLVVLKGLVKPSHRDYQAEVWRRLPNSSVWRKLKEVDIYRHGGMFFKWRTDDDDAYIDAPYSFQFRIPGHGRSNKVRLEVIPPDW